MRFLRAAAIAPIAFGVLILLAPAVSAGRIVLDNGSIIDGPIEEFGPDGVVIRYRDGRVTFPRSAVVRIEFGPGDPYVREVARSLRASAIREMERAEGVGAADLAPFPFFAGLHRVEEGDASQDARDYLAARDAYAAAQTEFRQAREDAGLFATDRGLAYRRLAEGAVGFAARAATGASPPAQPSLIPLQWNQRGLTLPYPGGWAVESSPDALSLIGGERGPFGRPSIVLAVEPSGGAGLDAAVERVRASLTRAGVALGEESRPVLLAGTAGRLLEGRAVEDGVPVEVVYAVVADGDRFLVLAAFAPGPRAVDFRRLVQAVLLGSRRLPAGG